MVKQFVSSMSSLFSRERFGRPQAAAAILLLIFIGECAWLLTHEYRGAFATTEDEFVRIEEGLAQWKRQGIAGTASIRKPLDPASSDEELYDRYHSPLWYLISAAPVMAIRVPPDSILWGWLTRAPYIVFGVLLGASVWYVARRLYGNAGGYVALGLYCFSPAVIRASTLWLAQPSIGGVWGTFGAVFTAIAVSHTLYAPREVVLWNWRRIVLLGVSLALAVGTCFGLIIILPVLLGFMYYLAPQRRRAATIILGTAILAGAALIFCAYFFHGHIFLMSLRHAAVLDLYWRAATMPGAYSQILREIAESGPILIVLAPAALLVFLSWPRTRYFGNIAPLIVAALFLILRLFSPHDSGAVFMLAAVIFIFVFVAGIAADLMETAARQSFSAVFAGVVAANALWDVLALARVGR
jgi:hypothetical protein